MNTPRVAIGEIEKLALRILELRGFPENEAAIICECLLYAQLRGNNQGLQKLKDMTYTSTGPIEVVSDTPTVTILKGNNNHSMVVLAHACETAVGKARKVGVGIVGTNSTNTSSGALGYFTSKIAIEQQLIAVLAATTTPVVAPYGSKEARIGTNPLSVAFPSEGDPVVFDATTAQWSYYALVEAAARGESIPPGVALDSTGEPTTDAREALQGTLLPRGILGWGMGVVVQLLAGPLVGAFCKPGDKNNWGHYLLVLDPGVCGERESYLKTVSSFWAWVKTAQKQTQIEEFYLPGERGNRETRENRNSGTLPIDEPLYHDLVRMASQ